MCSEGWMCGMRRI